MKLIEMNQLVVLFFLVFFFNSLTELVGRCVCRVEARLSTW